MMKMSANTTLGNTLHSEFVVHFPEIKALLDSEVSARNQSSELSYERPDPLLVASRYKDETIALICALFGYGNARQIVKFLDSLDFGLLDEDEAVIRSMLGSHYYRFQKSWDVSALFIALKRLKSVGSIEEIFYEGYRKEHQVLDGLWHFIDTVLSCYPRDTYGYRFLIGRVPSNPGNAGTFKRYMMFLRWMVRHDSVDLGLWTKISKRDLIIPLDTHTFNVSRRVGLLNRRSCDMKAALELTHTLRRFDPEDPVKYDFALYRLGQERIL